MKSEKTLSINEILLRAVNPLDLNNDIPETELRLLEELLDSRLSEGFLITRDLRDDILHHYLINISKDYVKREISNYFELLENIIAARTIQFEQKLQKNFRKYGKNKKFIDKKIGYLSEEFLATLPPNEAKIIRVCMYTHQYTQYNRNGTSSYDFTSLINEKFECKNEIYIHDNPNKDTAHFPLFLLRQKSRKRIGQKLLKKIMIEYTLSQLEKRPFNEQNTYFYDYNGLRSIARTDKDYKYIVSFLEKNKKWIPDGLEHPKHADENIGSKTNYLINRDVTYITICFHFLPIVDALLNDFASGILKRSRYEKDWYNLFDDEKEKINEAAKKHRESHYTANKFERDFFKKKETIIFARRLENILGYKGLLK